MYLPSSIFCLCRRSLCTCLSSSSYNFSFNFAEFSSFYCVLLSSSSFKVPCHLAYSSIASNATHEPTLLLRTPLREPPLPADFKISVLATDENFIVVDKPRDVRLERSKYSHLFPCVETLLQRHYSDSANGNTISTNGDLQCLIQEQQHLQMNSGACDSEIIVPSEKVGGGKSVMRELGVVTNDAIVTPASRNFLSTSITTSYIAGTNTCSASTATDRGTLLGKFRICGRLDFATSGVLILCINKLASKLANKCLEMGKISKVYLAMCYGHMPALHSIICCCVPICKPSPGSFEMRIGGNLTQGKFAASLIMPYKHAVFRNQAVTLCELRTITGRRHQLRVHMSAVGHPIVGDKSYFDCRRNEGKYVEIVDAPRLMLHCWRIKCDYLRLNVSTFLDAKMENKISDCHLLGNESCGSNNDVIDAEKNQSGILDVIAQDCISPYVDLPPRKKNDCHLIDYKYDEQLLCNNYGMRCKTSDFNKNKSKCENCDTYEEYQKVLRSDKVQTFIEECKKFDRIRENIVDDIYSNLKYSDFNTSWEKVA